MGVGGGLSQCVGRPSVSYKATPVCEIVVGGGFVYAGVCVGGVKGSDAAMGFPAVSRGKCGGGRGGGSTKLAYGLSNSGFLLGGEVRDEGTIEGRGGRGVSLFTF